MRVRRIADLGRKRLAYVDLGAHPIVATVPPDMAEVGERVNIAFDAGPYACLCRRHARAGSDGVMDKPINNRAWFFVLPVLAFVLFSSIIPMMTVVNYSIQDTLGANNFFWNGDAWFRDLLNPATAIGARFNDALFRTLAFSLRRPCRSKFRSASPSRYACRGAAGPSASRWSSSRCPC